MKKIIYSVMALTTLTALLSDNASASDKVKYYVGGDIGGEVLSVDKLPDNSTLNNVAVKYGLNLGIVVPLKGTKWSLGAELFNDFFHIETDRKHHISLTQELEADDSTVVNNFGLKGYVYYTLNPKWDLFGYVGASSMFNRNITESKIDVENGPDIPLGSSKDIEQRGSFQGGVGALYNITETFAIKGKLGGVAYPNSRFLNGGFDFSLGGRVSF